MNDARKTYSAPAITFHWVTVILVVVAFLISVGGPESRVYAPQNSTDLSLHELLGFSVFALTCVRLVWRLFDPPPPPVEMPGWMHAASRLVHWTLYALLLVTPLTAVWAAWAEGHALTPLGLGSIAPVIGENKTMGSFVADIHGLLGDAIMWVAGLHAAAALYHHFLLRDCVLSAMLPWVGRP
jgi:cytochrome b561